MIPLGVYNFKKFAHKKLKFQEKRILCYNDHKLAMIGLFDANDFVHILPHVHSTVTNHID